jgi:RecB family exonuclease
VSTVTSVVDGLCRSGGEIRFWRCADERVEALAVAADIERLVFHDHVSPRRIAVLLPEALGEARELLSALEERAIPHRPHGAGAMLQRAEIRDALAWMRLLIDPGDAGAAVRALIRPPIEMRHVDLAQVVQIARRRRLDVVAALPAAVESPQVPPEARERIHRFLELHGEAAIALAEMTPQRFLDQLLDRLGAVREGPLSASSALAQRGASLAWLQAQARAFCRRYPWADGREMVLHLLAVAESGDERVATEPGGSDGAARVGGMGRADGAAGAGGAANGVGGAGGAANGVGGANGGAGPGHDQGEGLVQLARLDAPLRGEIDHAYLVGMRESQGSAATAGSDTALGALAELGCRSVVLSYAVGGESHREAAPDPAIERMRSAIGTPWEEMAAAPVDPDQAIEAALRAMRQELLDGVASIGGRLRELRLDTEIDVSHGIVRYLELVKLAALLERPAGQSIAEALADVNARLLPAVSPLQREILESSSLDEELLAGRGLAQAAPALGRAEAGAPSLQRFLPRRGEGLLLSASDIETYRSCPLRYKFARVLRIPTPATRHQRFGIAVHQVLERYHTQGGGPLEQLLALLEESWRRAGFGLDAEDGVLHEKALAALRLYHERLSQQRCEPVWFERAFSFSLGRHHVRGRVDRVDRLPDGSYELIDYKTGRPRSEQQLQQDIQLSLYAIAAKESWGLHTSSQAYYYLLDDQKVPLPSTAGGAEWVRQTAVEIAEAILQERFEPTPSPAACGMCDFRIVCPVAGE